VAGKWLAIATAGFSMLKFRSNIQLLPGHSEKHGGHAMNNVSGPF